MRRWLRVVGVWTVAATAVGSVLWVLPQGTASLADATSSGSCAWEAHFDPTIVNIAFPDQSANYWVTQLPAVPGETLSITGRYPHARYISFTSYNAALQSVDGLNDTAIDPDPGSVNPFLAGNPRTLPDDQRHYSVKVVFGRAPAPQPHNTLYTTSADGSRTGTDFLLIYRVYVADQGLGIEGGEPLPEVTVDLPNGTGIALPDCPQIATPPNDLNQQLADANRALNGSGTSPTGTNPPIWHRFYNFETSYGLATQNAVTGWSITDPIVAETTTLPRGGFFDNPDNAYITTTLTSGFGALAVFSFKLPTTPDTYSGATVMGSGQLRYWSLCSNEAFSQRVYGCVRDDQLRPSAYDSNGDYVVVVSDSADRPTGLPAACPVTWLPAGPAPDTVLILRNMLPDPTFTEAVQDAGYGDAANHFQVTGLGPYYPVGRYYTTTASFDALFAGGTCPTTGALTGG